MILADEQWYGKGSYAAYSSPWGRGDAVYQTDYAESIELDEATFPNGAMLKAHWPLQVRNMGEPRAYVFLDWGMYDGADQRVPIKPKQAGAIRALRNTFNTSLMIVAGGCNFLTEFYLRADPNDNASKKVEIGFFPHADQTTHDFAARGTQLGTFVDPSGRTWNVASQPNPVFGGLYVMFFAATEFSAGQIDEKQALDWLSAKGLVDKEWWFTGHALGIELINGSAAMAVKRWTMTYA